jgi:hypothetical protein
LQDPKYGDAAATGSVCPSKSRSQPRGMLRWNATCNSASRSGVMPTFAGVKKTGSRVNIR